MEIWTPLLGDGKPNLVMHKQYVGIGIEIIIRITRIEIIKLAYNTVGNHPANINHIMIIQHGHNVCVVLVMETKHTLWFLDISQQMYPWWKL